MTKRRLTAVVALLTAACAARGPSLPKDAGRFGPVCQKQGADRCFAEGQALMSSDPQKSLELVTAACVGKNGAACDFWQRNISPPRRKGPTPSCPSIVDLAAQVRCVIGADGLARDCHVLSSGGPSLDHETLRILGSSQFEPARWAGAPVEVQYTVKVHCRGLKP